MANGGIIDLRGSPTGLEGLGEGLASLIGAITRDPNDELRRKLLDNPVLGRQVAMAARERGRNIQSGETPVDPRVGDASVPTEELSLPPTAGLGIFPPEIINELMTMFPETREEKVAAEVAARLTPGEEADIVVAGARAEGEASLLSNLQSERMIATINAADSLGATPEALAQLQMLQLNIETTGARLDLEGITSFTSTYENASPQDKAIIEAGLSGPRAQVFAQALVQRERFDLESEAADLRAVIASAQSIEEIDEARVISKLRIRRRTDEVVDRINAAAADRNRKDELPGLIGEMRDLAIELLRVDPSLVVQTANEITGIIRRNNITGAEFSITDITDSNADKVELAARMLAAENISDAAVAQMRGDLTDRALGGRVNERLMLSIVERAIQIVDDRPSDNELHQVATMEAREIMGDQAAQEANNQSITDLESQLDVFILQGDSTDGERVPPGVITELSQEIWRRKLVRYYAGGGSPSDGSRLPVPVPRTEVLPDRTPLLIEREIP